MWEGGLVPFLKLITMNFVLVLLVFVGVQAFAVVGTFPLVSAAIIDSILVVEILLNFIFLRLLKGVRFYITNRRIVRTRGLLLRNKPLELPLESMVDVVSRRIKGKGYLSFVSAPPGLRQIILGPFKDDPEKVREIVLRARSNLAIRS